MCVFVFFSLHLSIYRFKFVFVFSPHTDSFRWVKDGKEFRRELFESGTLTADEKEELRSYQGSYRCYVANELGTAVSDLARLITECESLLKHHKQSQLLRLEKHNVYSITLHLCTETWMTLSILHNSTVNSSAQNDSMHQYEWRKRVHNQIN